MNTLSSNKKILITVGIFVVVIAVLVGVLKIASNKSDYPDDETTTGSVFYNDESQVSENVTNAPVTNIPQENLDSINENVAEDILAYMSGQYYLDGIMVSDGVETSLQLAMSGKNFQTSADIDGMNVSILYKDSKIYFIDLDKKQYILLSDVLMDQVDMDFSELEQLTEYLNLTQYNFTDYSKYEGEFDGNAADCYKYSNQEMSVVFYFIGEELKQVDMGDNNGNVNSVVKVNSFSPEVPDSVMSLNGLKKTTLIGFFGGSLS